MNAQFLHDGSAIDFTPTENIKAGDIITLGGLVGVARLDVNAGTQGTLSLSGVYKISKTSEKFISGETVFWNANVCKATHSKSGNSFLGKVVSDASDTDDSVSVRLEQPAGAFFANAMIVPAHSDSGQSSNGDESAISNDICDTYEGISIQNTTDNHTNINETVLLVPLLDNTGGSVASAINSVLFDTLDRQTANTYASLTAKINEIIAVLERKGLVRTHD